MQLETSLTFAASHPVFAGHFPGRPIVPGALLLDEVLHAALLAGNAALQGTQTAAANGPLVQCQIASVKFLSPVAPGETVLISCTGTTSRPTRFTLTCQGRPVATGTFVLETAP